MKSSNFIRQEFLNFFQEKGHKIVESAPLLVKNDPTLLFVNAGMNPFKDIFLGLKNPDATRVADTQKCMRVSGKHNDLDDVGHDTYHHTMFEMLGNWSFGDYYKQEAIAWAWELLTKRYEIDPDRLYVTIFEGDQTDGIPKDTEAVEFWRNYVPEDRILPFDKKDNFWEMGDTGPCGPCSEIHMDMRSDEDRAKVDGGTLVNMDHPEVIEIWNLVFIQFNRQADKSLVELPDKHVDTGMGFERLVMALQNKLSSYDTDLFDRTRGFLEKKTGLTYAKASEKEQIAMRVIMDHIRSVVFTISDGQIPDNKGAGYVIRRILRRASRYAYSSLDLKEPFLNEMVELVAEEYKGIFPNVKEQLQFIQQSILAEEQSFLRTLGRGIQLFEKYLADNPGTKQIDGKFAFTLYDTFGFPIDLTAVMATEKGLSIDMKGFDEEMKAQQERGKKLQKVGDWTVVEDAEELPVFKGYDQLELETSILRYRTVEAEQGGKKKGKKTTSYQLVLKETPFYAESGGQVGDKGILFKGNEQIRILDTQKENELIVHQIDKLPESAEGIWTAQVNAGIRKASMANHTATHLLHAALRATLGAHVEQRGSLVSDKILRFDFSHFNKVTEEELTQIETEVNAKIAAAIPFVEHREMPIEDAKKLGAMALFGEKYGDKVRVVIFDPAYSVEFCGGTHVSNTSEIRLFKIISESSSAAGIRRIEALTADKALNHFNEQLGRLDTISAMMKSPQNLEKAVQDMVDQTKELEKKLHQLQAEKVAQLKGDLLKKVEEFKGVKVIRSKVSVPDSDAFRQLAYDLKKVTENTLIVLGTEIKEKPQLSIIMSDDLAESGKYHAGNMVRTLAQEIKGGGGGQPFFATAGGKDATGIPKALAKVEELL